MRQRFQALDGLRGFAAFAVMLSHAGVRSNVIWDSPIFHYFMRTIGAGSSAVQILFVLSGFLMAYLYPTITDTFTFLQKRYARIIPVYAVVVMYIAWVIYPNHALSPLGHLALLAGLGLALRWSWQALHQAPRWQKLIGRGLFVGFMLLQIGHVVASLSVWPLLEAKGIIPQTAFAINARIFLDNVTLTTPFQREVIMMSGVFWSLLPELLFYCLYPFAVVPLIALSKKWSGWVSLLVTLAVVKVIWDIDAASFSALSLHTMWMGRATGFVVGVWVGTMLLRQGKYWDRVETVFRHPAMNVLLLAGMFFLLAGEFGDTVHQVRSFMNYFYLILSIVVGGVVIAAVQSNSLIERIFRQRFLVFLGTISYSLYLIHTDVMEVLHNADYQWHWSTMFGNGRIEVLWSAVVMSVLSISVAALLFWLVESLYFQSKKKVTALEAKKPNEKKVPPVFEPKRWQVLATWIIGFGLLTVFYSSSYSPSILMARHSLPTWTSVEPIVVRPNQPLSLEFTAQHSNLSVVIVGMDYVRDPQVEWKRQQPPVLQFQLFDEQNQLVFTSERHPQQVEGVPNFPFGLPTITDSQGKRYRVELRLLQADPSDAMFVKNSPNGFMTQSITAKELSLPYLWKIASQRLWFAWTHTGFLFAAAGFTLLAYQVNKKCARA